MSLKFDKFDSVVALHDSCFFPLLQMMEGSSSWKIDSVTNTLQTHTSSVRQSISDKLCSSKSGFLVSHILSNTWPNKCTYNVVPAKESEGRIPVSLHF